MAGTHPTATRDAATNAVINLIGANAILAFRIAGPISAPGAIAASLIMTTPSSFGTSSGGTATAAAITTNTNVAGNASPVATATVNTSGGTAIFMCTVAAVSGGDINISSGGLTFNAGDTVSCSSLTYTALAA